MDLTIARKDLLSLATMAQGIASHRSPLPILADVLLSAEFGGVRASATDLSVALTAHAPAEVSRSGTAAVPVKLLVERVKVLPDGPVRLTVGDRSSVTLRASGSSRRFTLAGVPSEDFPQLPQPDSSSPCLTLEATVLGELLAKTHFSILPDETRAHINCALFELGSEVARMVTTDGHRLTKVERPVPGKHGEMQLMIQSKVVHELRRLCALGGDLTITQSGASAFFEMAGVRLSAKLVDAEFPPYTQVIPKSSQHDAQIPTGPFVDAVRAMSVAASDRTGGVCLSFSPGTLCITAGSAETGNGSDEIAVSYMGPDVMVCLNASYLLDVLGVLDDEEVSAEFSGELDPFVVRAGGLLAVIMPLRG